MVDSVFEFYIGGSLVAVLSAPPVSWSTATLLLGEGQGSLFSQPASTWWFDQASILQFGVQQLGNTGYESALAGNYLTPNVYNNWCNIHPSRGANRYNDLSYAGSWSGGIKKGIGLGCWLHQDTTMTSLDYSEVKVMVRRSSTTPNGAFGMQLMLDWDRGGGFATGYATIYQNNSNVISVEVDTTSTVTQTGISPIPDDTWVEWKIRIYPLGIVYGWHIGHRW